MDQNQKIRSLQIRVGLARKKLHCFKGELKDKLPLKKDLQDLQEKLRVAIRDQFIEPEL